jgi:hypothetical protein
MGDAEKIYRMNVQYGHKELKPIEHVLTWLDHDRFEVRSEYMTFTWPADDLGIVLAYVNPIAFANERPPRLSLWKRLSRLAF